MLNMIFEKPRYRVRAGGGLVTVQGIIFANIEKGLLATTLMIVGSLFVAGGLYVELLALATLAFNILIRAFQNLRLSIERARETWAREAGERERQSHLAVVATRRQEALDVVMPTKQTTNAVIYYSPPFKAKETTRRQSPEWRDGGRTVSVRAHRRRLPRRRR